LLALELTVAPTDTLAPNERQEIVELCSRAFGQDFSNLFDYLARAREPWHVRARLGDQLVGHAVWTTRWLQPEGQVKLRTAYVDAVATDPSRWGQGIGSAVLSRLAEETDGYALGALSTQRASFYEHLGWERWRGPCAVRSVNGIVATPNETVLVRRTPHTPPLDLDGLLVADWRGGQPW
jgi:aminoglycoside 2'-N-acetyltransferase I